MSRLLLFDIDCTLVDTGGAGMQALKETAHELFGAEGPELDLAGNTDSSIVQGILDHFGSDLDHDVFYQLYLSKLPVNLDTFAGRVLPGVDALLDRLTKKGSTFGLLTGNMKEGAWAKLFYYGLNDYFAFGAFGDDHHDRNKLGPLALARACELNNQTYLPEQTVVIGDTPKDIACGRAMGAITLAVATGGFCVEELIAYGADYAVEDLEDPEVESILV